MASGNRSSTNRRVMEEIGELIAGLPDDRLITSEYICEQVNSKTKSRRFCVQRIAALLRERTDLERNSSKRGWFKVKCNA